MTGRQIPITINGKHKLVLEGTSVAAAVMMASEPCRRSVRGQPRAALCGMGTCMECRMTINGIPHRRACQLICAPGMEVVTE
ncbi:MAG TPA: (2Fe-2S)-binding protein [Terracidiphilus sp.]